MKTKLLLLFLLTAISISFAQTPVAQWSFDDPNNLVKADIGDDLILVGVDSAVAGPEAGDGAVSIGIGSYYIANPYMLPSGADTAKRVNIYTMVFDFRILDVENWHCFGQTDPTNTNDGEWFINPDDGNVGVGASGYTKNTITPGEWYRLAIVVNTADTNDNSGVKYYFDGIAQSIQSTGHVQQIDNRFSIASADSAVQLLLFADESEEDDVIEVAKVSIYEQALSNAEVAALGGFQHEEIEEFRAVGLWDFNNPEDLTEATIGSPLELVGTAEVVAGPADGNGAVSIGVGSFFKALTSIAPNGGGTKVNTYSTCYDASKKINK